MALFAVSRQAGPAWIEGKGAFDQPGVSDHAAFMDALSEEGFVIFAGPLAGTESGAIRVLLVADAADEVDVLDRLAEDPWERTERITTTAAEPWALLVGANRLPSIEHRR